MQGIQGNGLISGSSSSVLSLSSDFSFFVAGFQVKEVSRFSAATMISSSAGELVGHFESGKFDGLEDPGGRFSGLIGRKPPPRILSFDFSSW